MEISPVLQARLLLYSFLFGGVACALADVASVLCHSVKRLRALSLALRFLLDLLLCALAGCGFILLCYYFNDGVVRGFAAIGLCVGFICWRVTLSRIFRRLLLRLLSTFFAIVRLLLLPAFKIFEFLVKKLKKIAYSIFKSLAKCFNMVYNIYVKMYVAARAKNGFIKK